MPSPTVARSAPVPTTSLPRRRISGRRAQEWSESSTGTESRYAGARGTVTTTDAGPEGSIVTLRYRR